MASVSSSTQNPRNSISTIGNYSARSVNNPLDVTTTSVSASRRRSAIVVRLSFRGSTNDGLNHRFTTSRRSPSPRSPIITIKRAAGSSTRRSCMVTVNVSCAARRGAFLILTIPLFFPPSFGVHRNRAKASCTRN